MFYDVVRDIKSIKIQGAANIALAGIDALTDFFSKKSFKTKKALVYELDKRIKILLSARPNEPLLYNSLNYVKKDIALSKDVNGLKKIIIDNARSIKIIVEEMRQNITSTGANRIKNNSKILTHCHSSSVVELLKLAKQRNINFEIFNTETRPLYQGRKTAKELSRQGIKVTHFVDSAVGLMIKKADMVLVGCDVITSDLSIVNKIGTYPLAVVAKRENVPLYVVAELLKFDPRTIYNITSIEERKGQEVWDKPPKNVKVYNPAFDITPRELITGFITEFGLMPPENIFQTIKEKYSWIF